jgi:uncharacterized membrane-anchored protein YhcB (DUF1043 family)
VAGIGIPLALHFPPISAHFSAQERLRVYGLEWLIVSALVGTTAGAVVGAALASRRSQSVIGRSRDLEAQLESARAELAGYRRQVAEEFSATASKFRSLNDAYTELHQQLARSSSVLCGDAAGPLVEAPRGHSDLAAPASTPEAAPDAGTPPESAPETQSSAADDLEQTTPQAPARS